MCIGIPMQVIEADGRFALCEGRGERRRIHTALVGDVLPGDWLLVFLDDARERIDADRATEVNAALDLVLRRRGALDERRHVFHARALTEDVVLALQFLEQQFLLGQRQIGRASCRERVS
jgi:hydrogenase assembly chaperone HypC/HupF